MPAAHNIDAPAPAFLRAVDSPIHVAGWFCDEAGFPALAIRVRIGRELFECQPIVRPDVQAHFLGRREVHPRCGFVTRVHAPRGLHRLHVEALTRDNQTIRLGSRRVFILHHHQETPVRFDEVPLDKVLGLLRPANAETPPPAASRPVAVIVPIYRDVGMTRTCLERAMGEIAGHGNRRLLAINDASPEAGMAPMLAELARRWPRHFAVLENKKNLGFVRTINRGLQAADGADVVLLNSDAHVANDWLSRLQQAAWARPDVGTVTPLSNNAALASFPNAFAENPLFLNLPEAEIDLSLSRHRLPDVEAPTGVGFCMYVRADCLARVGPLDEKNFGRGYGEENDFCQRALRHGFKNLITPNVYVRHFGGMSFAGEKAALMAKARKALRRLHPSYFADVVRFANANPLAAARLCRMCEIIGRLQRPVILAISHHLGGGTRQHIAELAAHLGDKAHFVLIRPGSARDTLLIHPDVKEDAGESIALTLPQDWEPLLALLCALRPALVHFHHTMGVPRKLHDLPRALGLPHVVTVHDYHWIGANPTLVNDRHRYEGDPLRAPMGKPDLVLPEQTPEAWREAHRPLLETAREVIFPSRSTRDIFGTLYRFASTRVVPHPEDARPAATRPPKPVGSSVNIGLLGDLSLVKGSSVVEALARLSRDAKLPWRYTLIGRTDLPLPHVVITGGYKPEQLADLINHRGIDVFFFPALCPETYSYTLSYALASHRPIMASSIGCFPERLETAAVDTLLFDVNLPPAELLSQVKYFIHTLQTTPKNPGAMNAPPASPAYYTGEYLAHCRRAATRS